MHTVHLHQLTVFIQQQPVKTATASLRLVQIKRFLNQSSTIEKRNAAANFKQVSGFNANNPADT
jgi:hypothetical protein